MADTYSKHNKYGQWSKSIVLVAKVASSKEEERRRRRRT
jgi:hypothetical protein